MHVRQFGQKGQRVLIRSRLAKYQASGIDPKTGKRVTWEVLLRPGNSEDRNSWLRMTATGGFRDVKLAKLTTTVKRTSGPKTIDPDIARQGLELLDRLIAARRAKS